MTPFYNHMWKGSQYRPNTTKLSQNYVNMLYEGSSTSYYKIYEKIQIFLAEMLFVHVLYSFRQTMLRHLKNPLFWHKINFQGNMPNEFLLQTNVQNTGKTPEIHLKYDIWGLSI